MVAANNNTVEVDEEMLVRYNLFNTCQNVPTGYIETLKYDRIIGLDFEKFKLTVDFGKANCSLPGRRMKSVFSRIFQSIFRKHYRLHSCHRFFWRNETLFESLNQKKNCESFC